MKITFKTLLLLALTSPSAISQLSASLPRPQDYRYLSLQSSLEKAIKTCDLNKVQTLIEQNQKLIDSPLYGQRNVSPLMLAAEIGSPAMVKYLLDKKASLMCKDSKGQNVFHYWIKATRNQFVTTQDRIETLHLLMEYQGALLVVPLQDAQGWTPLHHACFYEQEALAEALIEQLPTAALNIQDHEGKTPLHTAIERKNELLVALLIEHDANYLFYANDGTSVYKAAAKSGLLEPLVMYIVRHKALFYWYASNKKIYYASCERKAAHIVLRHALKDFEKNSPEAQWLYKTLA